MNLYGPITVSQPSFLASAAPYAGALAALLVLATTLYVTGKRERTRSTLERIDANRRESREICLAILNASNYYRTLLGQLSMRGIGNLYGSERVNNSLDSFSRLGAELSAQCQIAEAILAVNGPALKAVSAVKDCSIASSEALAKGVIASNAGGTGAQIDEATGKARSLVVELKGHIERLESVVAENMRPTIVDEAATAGDQWRRGRP